MKNKTTDESMDRINFLVMDIAILEAQLSVGSRIVPVVRLTQNHPEAPTEISYKATNIYVKMDNTDRNALSHALKSRKEELAKLKAKATVEISFKKDEENKKGDNKKD